LFSPIIIISSSISSSSSSSSGSSSSSSSSSGSNSSINIICIITSDKDFEYCFNINFFQKLQLDKIYSSLSFYFINYSTFLKYWIVSHNIIYLLYLTKCLFDNNLYEWRQYKHKGCHNTEMVLVWISNDIMLSFYQPCLKI